MSKARQTTEKLVKYGEFRLHRQILETPSLLQFVGSEESGLGSPVSLTTLRRLTFPGETRKSLVQSLHILQTLNFRSFPQIVGIDSASPSGDIWVINEWMGGRSRSLREVIAAAQQSDRPLDPGFAFYVLKTLTSAVSALHRCRVSELKTVHGAISPDTVWIGLQGEIYLYNYFFGLALGFEQGYSLEETEDLRGLGETFWTAITGERWSGPERVEETRICGGADVILKACGLVPGDACWSTRDFTRVLNEVIGAEPYYISRNYAAAWLSKSDRMYRAPDVAPGKPEAEEVITKTPPEMGRTPKIPVPIAVSPPLPSPRPFPWLVASLIVGVLVVLGILASVWLKPPPPGPDRPDPQISAQGFLAISVDPGVEVVVDRISRGRTPLLPLGLAAGPHTIEYRYEGKTIAAETVQLESGKTTDLTASVPGSVNFALVSPTANVTLTIDNAAPITLRASGSVPVAPGARRFRLTAAGFEPLEFVRNIPGGEKATIDVTLSMAKANAAPAPAALVPVTVEALIPVSIYDEKSQRELGRVDGGTTTLNLAPGSHNLQLRYEQRVRDVSLNVVAGKTIVLDANFNIKVSINARPGYARVSLIAGSQSKDLGDTDMANMEVPIGGTLEFTNPQGTSQRIPITGQSSSITARF